MSEKNEREKLAIKLKDLDILIFGAQVVAYEIYRAVTELYCSNVIAFLVTDKSGNPEIIESIPVKNCEYLDGLDKTIKILVATPEIYHSEIMAILYDKGFHNIMKIDSHIEYLIMSAYFRTKKEFLLLEDLPECNDKNYNQIHEVNIYMAKSIYDKALVGNHQYSNCVIPIQVGRELTEKKICELGDNIGSNISAKNRNYSELTATYYVWKNIHSCYKGICHYRRILVLNSVDLSKIHESDVDVILPLPFLCYTGAERQYGRYISKTDMELVWQVLKEFNPFEYESAWAILHDAYLYNYNIVVAKEAVFDEYCEWLFPRLFRIEELNDEKNSNRQDRYIGYIGEILTSFYFIYFSKKYKIFHAEKKWLI